MRVVLLLILLTMGARAQDKLFYENGETRQGILVSVGKQFVFFKLNDSSAIEKIPRAELVMATDHLGTRYLLSSPDTTRIVQYKPVFQSIPHPNLLGIQPMDVLAGRLGLCYERISLDDKISVMVPLSLTFNPFGVFYRPSRNPAYGATGVYNLIGGFDVNIYTLKGDNMTLFFGPRFRYGLDVMLNQSEAITLQTQAGVRIGHPDDSFVQHASIGLGFAKVFNYNGVVTSSRSVIRPWFSLNYRLSVAW